MATTATLKIKCEDTVHRLPLQEHQVEYEAITERIRSIYPGEVTAKYLDDEGDMCVLCAATFSDFLSMSDAGGGKVVLKLELSPGARAPAAAHQAGQAEPGVASPVAAIAGVLQGLKGHFKGKWKGKCKGKSHGKGKGGSDAGADEHETANHSHEGFGELFHKFGASEGLMEQAMGGHASGALKLGRALRQLHSADMVSARCVAAVVANSLGDLIAFAAEHAKAIDWAASVKPEVARQVTQALLDHAACAEGLEDCAGKMEAALAGVAIPASEVILGLLTALSELAFGARVSFLEALYTSQQERIDGLLDRARPFLAMLPPIQAEHSHHICDGCDQAPLRGPRFKCKSLADYDLCARCFSDKDSLPGGRCAGHEFETIAGTVCAEGKGKGMCKGKGKGKQKGKGDVAGKGGRCAAAADTNTEASDASSEQQAADPASFMDCDSQAPTDCDSQATAEKGKGKGKSKGKGKDKSKCEGPEWSKGKGKSKSKGKGKDKDKSKCDGLHANLEWNLVDDPREVAEGFVALHGAPP